MFGTVTRASGRRQSGNGEPATAVGRVRRKSTAMHAMVSASTTPRAPLEGTVRRPAAARAGVGNRHGCRSRAPAAEAVHAAAGQRPAARRNGRPWLHTSSRGGPVVVADDPLERDAERAAQQVVAVGRRGDVTPSDIARAAAAASAARRRASTATGRRLEPVVRTDMEAAFGRDFSAVRVHADAAADRVARSAALAFTVGRDISFGAGRFAPQTRGPPPARP